MIFLQLQHFLLLLSMRLGRQLYHPSNTQIPPLSWTNITRLRSYAANNREELQTIMVPAISDATSVESIRNFRSVISDYSRHSFPAVPSVISRVYFTLTIIPLLFY